MVRPSAIRLNESPDQQEVTKYGAIRGHLEIGRNKTASHAEIYYLT